MSEQADIAVVGAGAAGLMAGIWAGRIGHELSASRRPQGPLRIVILDGARTIGAKILIAGGGRCNVTHDVVDERAFAGSTPMAIRKVLRRFDVPETTSFFRSLDVELKREETGKLFPVTDDARTVLDALLRAAHDARVEIQHPWRVTSIEKYCGNGQDENPVPVFTLRGPVGEIRARRVIIAAGGRSLPKTGSDGLGYELLRHLGHSITPRVFPALVPLTLPKDHWLCSLSGISAMAALDVRSGTGRKLHAFTDSLLCTHFGLSGPAALDVSRYYTDARMNDPGAQLCVNWLPALDVRSADASLQSLHKISPGRWLREHDIPERLARALCEQAGVDASAPSHQLTREGRRALANLVADMSLPITGDRGFTHAEVTAGGVPLNEIRLETMESRVCAGLYICGEVCDVDGRIGGYNFQWAWASGFVAGSAAASARAIS